MRLIDADAIPWTDLNDDPNSEVRVLITFADKVNRMPTIEPERKKGRWIEPTEDSDYWECSVCHDSYVLDVDVTPQDARMFFCPNCGADMRGDT